jgi:NitT/TauT family transport system ATP-binding protein
VTAASAQDGGRIGTAVGASGQPFLAARKVSLSFGAPPNERLILRDIDLDVGRGEFVCLVGPSGSGKTTLLRLIAGLLSPTRGQVEFEGQPVTGPSRTRAVVFQDYVNALLPWRTVAKNVELPLEVRNVPPEERKAIISDLLAKVGLSRVAQHYPGQLSGGMQQRLQIARCLAQEPHILLMDEPFGALDALTRQSLQDELLRICREQKVTAVFITHDLEEAIYLGDRVLVLSANPGEIIDEITIDLPAPRNQLTTKEHPNFLAYRHRLFGQLQGH